MSFSFTVTCIEYDDPPATRVNHNKGTPSNQLDDGIDRPAHSAINTIVQWIRFDASGLMASRFRTRSNPNPTNKEYIHDQRSDNE
jgi:hypothetical protein